MANKIEISFAEWKKRSTKEYIKAICKPCWELKYCPYGVLVENFEVRGEIDDPYRCRVFGHICPVFKIAEPLTETKEKRNISRNISSVTQRRVLRRDNYICQICNKPIPDNEVNFDHIIPWSKGGSSDESNIRLLCESCNKSRGNNFEDQYLIAHVNELYKDPYSINCDMLFDLLQLFLVAIELNRIFNELTEKVFCDVIKTEDIETDKFMYFLISQLWDLFHMDKFFLPVKKKENILKYRWGVNDGKIHSVDEVCAKYSVSKDYYCELEELLLRQVGLIIKNRNEIKDSSDNNIDNEIIKKVVLSKLCNSNIIE